MIVRCPECGQMINPGEPVAWAEDDEPETRVMVHENCADPEDLMAAGARDPAEDYPHGDF